MADQGHYQEFKELVNMTPRQLEKWLETDDSKSVGMAGGAHGNKKTGPEGEESTGHKMGREIVDLLAKGKGELSEDDEAAMAKVVGYIKRHLKQKPTKSDPEDSRWRYSLMNWGHDPMKDKG